MFRRILTLFEFWEYPTPLKTNSALSEDHRSRWRIRCKLTFCPSLRKCRIQRISVRIATHTVLCVMCSRIASLSFDSQSSQLSFFKRRTSIRRRSNIPYDHNSVSYIGGRWIGCCWWFTPLHAPQKRWILWTGSFSYDEGDPELWESISRKGVTHACA